MDKKRLLLLIAFLIICAILGTLLYFVFFKKPAATPVKPITRVTPSEPSDLPSAGDRTITAPTTGPTTLPSTGPSRTQEGTLTRPKIKAVQIVDNNVLSPSLSSNGDLQFYNKQDGKFYKINENGEKELLSDQVFYDVKNVVWSPKDNKSIIEYPDGSNIFYDFGSKKQVTLPKHWEEFSFDSDGTGIAAKSLGLSPENRWIVTANPEGNNIKLIEPLGNNASKVNVDWSPNHQIVGTTRTGEALAGDREEVLFVGLNQENFRSMTVEGRGFTSSWSPQGDKMLYSVYSSRSDFKPELWIVNSDPATIGGERKLLNVNTWPQKCSFSDDRFVYCGVPQNLETGAGIAPIVAENSPDVIYRIDIQTGAKTELPMESDGHVVDKMFVGDDGKTIYFSDKRRPGIFQVPL